MYCQIHTNREAFALCVTCGKPACPECLITLHGQEYCRPCLEARIAPEAAPARPPAQEAPTMPPSPLPAPPASKWSKGPDGKNEVLATVLGLFPGLGHLYLGLRTRGLHLMGGFIGALLLADVLQLDNILEPWLQLVAIFFSVFDAREAYARIRKGLPALDEPLFNLTVFQGKDSKKLSAYALIAVGVLAIARSMLTEVLSVYRYNSGLPERIILSLLLIAAGAYLLRGGIKDNHV